MAEKRDYYEVLGIQKGATEDEIKKAFRKKARENHPDLHPDDPSYVEKFQEINEANEVLSDPEKRARYDQFGHAGVDPNYGGGGGMDGFGGMGGFGDMSDILESIFGGFGGFGGSSCSNANAPRRGSDIQESVTINFMDACNGKKQEVKLFRMAVCETCHGSGADAGTTAEICPDCQGRGSVKTTQRTPFGAISSTKPCPHCGGKGKIVKNPCIKCRGVGRVRVQKTVNVDIPAGIALFNSEGYDIHCDIPVTYMDAVLGAEITVPTIDGDVKYNIAEGTQNGTVFRLKGKGIKKVNRAERGNQYVKIYVEVPKNLSKKQKELLREFEASLTDKNYAKRQNFFEKLKSKFDF